MSPSVSAPPVSGVPIELAEITDELTARIKSGETPDLDAIICDHPEYADELRRILPAMKLLVDLSRSGSVPSIADGDIPLGDLGDFRLIREVGRGGMGIVYEAEQTSLSRRVALKVLPFAATMYPQHLQRFKNESLAAASLEHPNIVPVYGVGCERAVHFYAMKFIEGQTLAQLIQSLGGSNDNAQSTSDDTAAYPAPRGSSPTAPIAGLSTKHEVRGKAHYRRIAELIAQAADALEHAHSMGIVHRDVKPGNLMLDAAGKVYVGDFGLARILSPAVHGGGELTMSGDLIGTLRYMSPEQALARHGLVDHRTDIYSLGATLYELLTLRPAVVGEDKAEILKQIAWEEPLALRKLDKSIPTELETITLKCMAKNPNERYMTAGELAEDLRRWLGDLAIKAKPPSFLDRAGKWAGRHRAGIAAAAACLILATTGLAVGVAILAKKESETSQANSREKRRSGQLEKSNNLLGSIFEKLDPSAEQKDGSTLREQLKAELLRAIHALDGDALGDQLHVAKLQATIGRSLLGLGEPLEAAKLLEKAHATRRALLGPDHPDTLKTLKLIAAVHQFRGRFSEAVQLYERVRDAQVSNLPPDHPDTLETLNNLSAAYAQCGRYDESIRILERVRDTALTRLGPENPDSLCVLNNLAVSYIQAGRLTQGIPLLEQVRDLSVVKLGQDHPETLKSLGNLGDAYVKSGNLREAVRLFEQAHKGKLAKLGPNHPGTFISLGQLAQAYQRTGRTRDAIQLFEQVHASLAAKLGESHPHTLVTANDLALAYKQSGKVAEAIKLYERVRDAQTDQLGADHPQTLTTLHNLAGAYRSSGKLPEAIQLYEQVREVKLAKLGANHPETLLTLNSLALAWEEAGKVPEAIRLYEQVRDARIISLGSDHPSTLTTLNNLAGAYMKSGKLAESIHLNERVRDAMVANLGANHPDTLTTLSNLARAHQLSGNLSEAVRNFEEAANGIQNNRFEHEFAAPIITTMIDCCVEANELRKAEVWARRWASAIKEKDGPDTPAYAGELSRLSLVLVASKNYVEAEENARTSLALRKKLQINYWGNYFTGSILGAALLGQGRHSAAEPLLVEGFEGMKERADKIPANVRTKWFTSALDPLIKLYEETNRPDEAAKYKAERDKLLESAKSSDANKK